MIRDALHFEASPRYSFLGRHGKSRYTVFAFGILGVLVVYIGWVAWQIAQVSEATQNLRNKRQLLATLMVSTSSEKPNSGSAPIEDALKRTQVASVNLTAEKRRMLNALVQQLNVPWHDIFEQLERLTPSDVALLSIEPDSQRAIIKFLAEAKSLEALLMYAESLQQHGVFGRLTYRKHETNEQDANRPNRLAFEMELLAPSRLQPNLQGTNKGLTVPLESPASKARP